LPESEIEIALPQVFPTIKKSGTELRQAAAVVIEQTDQEDLRTMANAYASTLDAEMKKAGRCAIARCCLHGNASHAADILLYGQA
jgi:hypothetical protein